MKLRTEDVAGAAGVREQMPEGDLGSHVLVGIAGKMLADGVVQRELARLDELQRRDGGEHLVHRSQAEPRVERHGSALLPVGAAPGLLEQHLAVPRHQHGAGELVLLRQLLGPGRERRQGLRLGHPRDREVVRAWDGPYLLTDQFRRLLGAERELEPGHGVRALLLHQRDDAGGLALLDAQQVEAAGLLAKTAADHLAERGIRLIGLVEGADQGRVSGIERREPRRQRLAGRRLGDFWRTARRGLAEDRAQRDEEDQRSADSCLEGLHSGLGSCEERMAHGMGYTRRGRPCFRRRVSCAPRYLSPRSRPGINARAMQNSRVNPTAGVPFRGLFRLARAFMPGRGRGRSETRNELRGRSTSGPQLAGQPPGWKALDARPCRSIARPRCATRRAARPLPRRRGGAPGCACRWPAEPC